MNKGLNLQKEQDELRGDEWKFGASSQASLFSIIIDAREKYLPVGELQNLGEDKFDCVTRASVNKLETEFTYAYQNNLIIPENKKWLEDNGYIRDNKITFSDAFIGILSGTTREGNSLKAPVHTIYKQGLIPKQLLPQLENFDAHYDIKRITPAMYRLGQDFLERFTLNYEQVDLVNLEKSLEKDMTSIALYGWGNVLNGEYQRTEISPNHCVIAFKLPKTYIFDNYIDSSDGDFIKKLAENYAIYPYGYRIFVTSQQVPKAGKLDIIRQILETIGQALGLIQRQASNLPPVDKPIEPKPQEVYNEVKETLMKYDWSTQEKARHSVRVICDEEGLTVTEKNELCATVGGESAWLPRATGKPNKDGTRDYGIVQLNSKYWIGEGKLYPNIEAVYNDPEGCIRWMCKQWKAGNKNWWYAFKNGSYKKYLNPKFDSNGKLI